KRGQLALHGLRIAVVNRQPLRNNASRIQVRLDELVVFLRIKSGGTFHPRVDRIGRDHIKLLPGREDEMARVVVDDASPPVAHHRVVLRGEELGRSWRNQRLQFTNDETLNAGVWNERAGSHACSESNRENGPRIRMKKSRYVSHHTLQTH